MLKCTDGNYVNEIDCDKGITESVTNDLTIRNIIKEFDYIFMKHKWDILKINLVKHEIITCSYY